MSMAFVKWLMKVIVIMTIMKFSNSILGKYISPFITEERIRIFLSILVLLWYLKIIRIPSINKLLAKKRET